MNTSLLVHLSRLLWYATNLRKLSMSISSSKSTVNMYLISDPLAHSPSRQNGQASLSRLSESKPGKPVHSTIHVRSHGPEKMTETSFLGSEQAIHRTNHASKR